MDPADNTRSSNPPQGQQLSRRAFVVGTVAGGFALAVLPVSAQTITTDTKGLVRAK
jgi:carboxymethylenebutenolidase